MRLIGLAVVLAVSLILAPLAAEAEAPGKTPRIGWLATSAPGPFDKAFPQGLREPGYVEGQNTAFARADEITQ